MEALLSDKMLPGQVNNGLVETLPDGGRKLTLRAGKMGQYRLAQIDDYSQCRRGAFSHFLPFGMSLNARVSSQDVPGTWGFGFWNDPFAMRLGLSRAAFRLPALPNAAWFFHASDENYLSFQDDSPGNGMLAGVFSAPTFPSIFSLAALPFVPFLFLPVTARIIRGLGGRVIRQSSFQLHQDWTIWHHFEIKAGSGIVVFKIDGIVCWESGITPNGRLGFVCWMDNQFLSLSPDGILKFGTLQTEKQYWLEISELFIFRG